MTIQSPTIFEAINARALRPEEVARNFVPSRHYHQLAKHRHTIVVGPRGSGKTTLLKMLQQPALEAWEDELADGYRSSINYTGVFIATDISWGAQLEALGDGKLDPESHKKLSVATFTTHVLRALVMAMLYRIESVTDKDRHVFRRVELSDQQESALVQQLCNAWQIEVSILSLLSLKQALSARLLQVRALASREALREHNERSYRLNDVGFLHLHFVEAVSIAIEIFNDLVGESEGRWALMFDELELAPQWIQDELLRALRSTDPKLLYKLAMSPFTYNASLMETALSAAPDQDFDQIALWYVDKRQSYKFCEGLWYALLKARGIEPRSPTISFGRFSLRGFF
jgi:energy-coupling factor transporter ATP-binding protein EcfA2